MSIADLGARGEFLGSIAVLATLFYLARQVRDPSRSMDRSACESIMLKLYRLWEQGMLPEKDWDVAARKAHQIFTATIRDRNFMQNNRFFDDLWAELETRVAEADQPVTDFGAV